MTCNTREERARRALENCTYPFARLKGYKDDWTGGGHQPDRCLDTKKEETIDAPPLDAEAPHIHIQHNGGLAICRSHSSLLYIRIASMG